MGDDKYYQYYLVRWGGEYLGRVFYGEVVDVMSSGCPGSSGVYRSLGAPYNFTISKRTITGY